MPKALRILAALVLVASAGACIESTTPRRTIADLLNQSNNHTTLRTAINGAGLSGYVTGTQGPEEITLFAPTDDAWAALPDTTRTAILSDPARLREVVLNQMADGRVPASQLSDGSRITTLAGEQVVVTGNNLSAEVGGAKLLLANLGAANGIMHVTDKVLLPTP